MLQLFNTLTRSKEEFRPLHDNTVGIYSCGPTVYNFPTIGNLRAYVFADILKRTLQHDGFAVKHIMNITDVGHLTGDRDMGEDKLAQTAASQHKSAWAVASFYTDAFLQDLKELNVLLPDKLPKATDHIKDMIALITTLEKRGYTYRTSDGIYFDTAKISDYGKLAKLDLAGLREGARVEINQEKKNPTDFALWKFSPPDKKRDMEWQSPWGIGFPGWHIECSAMSTKYLGQPFDIHTGGIDHVPVHHTNEIAQSEVAAHKPLAQFWLHNEFVTVAQDRMGKSAGNFITLENLKEKNYAPLAYRYFLLLGHYRSKLEFTWQGLDAAQNALDNLYSTIADYPDPKIGCAEFEREFFAALDDDLDTPKAIAVMWNLINSDYPPAAKLQSLFQFDQILGLSLKHTREELHRPLPPEIAALVQEREAARAAKDWDTADNLRRQVEALGYEIKDTAKLGKSGDNKQSRPIVRRKI